MTKSIIIRLRYSLIIVRAQRCPLLGLSIIFLERFCAQQARLSSTVKIKTFRFVRERGHGNLQGLYLEAD